MKYFVTKHCQKRYLERALNGNNVSDNILFTILDEIKTAKNITSDIANNNPRFLLYIKEKYGTKKGFNFLKYENIIYVLIKRQYTENLYDVITCYVDAGQMDTFKNTNMSTKEIYNKLNLIKYINNE